MFRYSRKKNYCLFPLQLCLFLSADSETLYVGRLTRFHVRKKEEKKTEENLFLGDFLVLSCVLFSSG